MGSKWGQFSPIHIHPLASEAHPQPLFLFPCQPGSLERLQADGFDARLEMVGFLAAFNDDGFILGSDFRTGTGAPHFPGTGSFSRSASEGCVPSGASIFTAS